MPEIPDLTDPRYLDEVGWFLYYEKYRRDLMITFPAIRRSD